MENDHIFWQAAVDELKRGYLYDKSSKAAFVCLVCERRYEPGVIYPFGGQFYDARRAVEAHIREEHGSMFEVLLQMDKKYTGLTPLQKDLLMMFYKGYSDKEVAERAGGSSISTIRNHRFSFREKYKQAKLIVAMMELLEDQKEENKLQSESSQEFILRHKCAVRLDKIYEITPKERLETLKRYFDSENRLVIKQFPVKDKKKVIILQYLLNAFEADRRYTEKEVNNIIGNYYEDIPTVRRYFVQCRFLERTTDGSAYWVRQEE